MASLYSSDMIDECRGPDHGVLVMALESGRRDGHGAAWVSTGFRVPRIVLHCLVSFWEI